MRFLLSGYYGYDNAGDEAVLAAILAHINAQAPGSEFVATSGAPQTTAKLHAGADYGLRCVGRDDFAGLWREIKQCDVFISGGGSLLQDVTSLRNIVYYTGLMRLAQLARKPVMVYAQGIGPLKRPLSQKLTRIALQHKNTRIIAVRDPDSKALLEKIGVRKNIEVTADPVWALPPRGSATRPRQGSSPLWMVSLRTWLNAGVPDAEAALLASIREAAKAQNATLQFLAMQPERDRALMESLGVAPQEILDTANRHPSEIMALTGACDLMIAMRLHALIFAAAQGVPCIAVSYDPKVTSLANLIGAPVVVNASPGELAKLHTARVAPPQAATIEELQNKARRNATLALGIKNS